MLLAAATMMPVGAEQIELNGKQHEVDELIDMSVGPGVTYKRLRSETYPLNINMLIVDVTNPYNRLETTAANETCQGTEYLVNAAKRQTTSDKRVLAGANANFWVVATQEPYSPTLNGVGYGGSCRNGQLITETNMHADQWNGGWTHTGLIGIDVDRMLHVGHIYYRGYVKNDKIGSPEIYQINKVVRDGEIGLYNSFYGSSKSFRPINQTTDASTKKPAWNIVSGESTEVLLDFVAGQQWKVGEPVKFTVSEIRANAGTGTLGSHAAALVGRGDKRDLLDKLAVGDVVEIETDYFDKQDQPIKFDNFVAGNAVVMENGELTSFNTSETYNSTVYARTGYGMSADGKTLYVVVVDKSTDLEYGKSAGCPARVMCELAKHYGCSEFVNCDGGGSAQMYVNGEIVNTTTEVAPRAVCTGMFMYSIAPEDKTVARLEFYDVSLRAPVYASYTPRIIAYNQYGDVLDYDFKDFTLSCPETLGSCEGNVFTAGGNFVTDKLTASYNGVSVSKDLTVEDSQPALRIKPLIIDNVREYVMEVTATVGENVYKYEPASLEWTVGDESIVSLSDQGLLKGLKNGQTTVKVKVGKFEDETTVSVEIPAEKYLQVTDYADWTFKQSGVKNAKMSADGRVDFTVAVSRLAPTLDLSKSVAFYGLPEKLWVEFESDIKVDMVTADVRTPVALRANTSETDNDGNGFAASTAHRVEFALSAFGDLDDLITFPMTINSVKFTFPKDASLNGEHYIRLKALETEYSNVSGVEDVAMPDDSKSVAVTGTAVDGSLNIKSTAELRSVSFYTAAGVLAGTYQLSGNEATINVGVVSGGFYVAVVETAAAVVPVKVIVK